MSVKPLKQLLTTSARNQESQRLRKSVLSTTLIASSVFSSRPFCCSSVRQDENGQVHPPRARWEAPPPRMTAPFRSKPRVYGNEFPVNESQERLDQVYEQFLGRRGDKMLTEEVKWLAITHKSFDHGRRGYNDRLAFLGMIAALLIRPEPLLTLSSNNKGRESFIYKPHGHSSANQLPIPNLFYQIHMAEFHPSTQL
jgi:large subunit ribosomal protein L15